MILLKQMMVFFLIMMIGLYLAKKDILDPATCKKVSWMVVNVCGPIMVINSVLGEERVPQNMMMTVYAIAFLIYVILLIVGLFMPWILRAKDCKVYSLMTVFGNVGFMGYPLVQEMYGQAAMLYAVVFNIFYNLFMYSYGITVMSGEKFELKQFKKMINPGMISSVIAFVYYIFPISLPGFLTQACQSVSNMTAPLSMMVIGASFATMNFTELFTDVRLLAFTALRYLCLPVMLMPVVRLFLADETLLGVCLIMIACPVGSMNLMVAQQYGGDILTSSKGIALTTLLSVIIMPVLFLILM